MFEENHNIYSVFLIYWLHAKVYNLVNLFRLLKKYIITVIDPSQSIVYI